MSDTDTTSTDQGNGTQPPKAADAGDKSAFTQDDITRIATREKDEGKRAGTREVLEALGFSSIDDAKRFKAALDEAERQKLSDTDRARQDAEAEKAAAQREKEEARKDRVDGWIESALNKAGITEDDDVILLARLLDVDYTSAKREEVTEAVKALKERKPALFTVKDDTDGDKSDDKGKERKPPPESDPGRGPGTRKAGESVQDATRSRLEARHGAKLRKNSGA